MNECLYETETTLNIIKKVSVDGIFFAYIGVAMCVKPLANFLFVKNNFFLRKMHETTIKAYCTARQFQSTVPLSHD